MGLSIRSAGSAEASSSTTAEAPTDDVEVGPFSFHSGEAFRKRIRHHHSFVSVSHTHPVELFDNGLAASLLQQSLLMVPRFVVGPGKLFDDDWIGYVFQTERDLCEMLLRQRAKLSRIDVLRGVVAKLMVVEDEVGGFGVGLLGFPVGVGDLADGEGAVVGGAGGRSAVALVAVLVRPGTAAEQQTRNGQGDRSEEACHGKADLRFEI